MPDEILIFAGEQANNDPFLQFTKWFEMRKVPVSEESGASILATADATGRPSSRVVLVREFDKNGFTFYTNYRSRKAAQISENPFGALLFFWPEIHRQVRIEGKIEKVPESRSSIYFSKRSRESQLSAWASEQSKTLTDRNILDARMAFYRDKFRDQPVPKPPGWGGYILLPDRFEFWQEGKDRLHDRISYYVSGDSWKIERLNP
jgi:pyridoxamine 5'-phosphate oxidase